MTCQGLFGKLFGHNYQPQYDKISNGGPSRYTGYELVEIIEALATKQYVCSVCTRCGDKKE